MKNILFGFTLVLLTLAASTTAMAQPAQQLPSWKVDAKSSTPLTPRTVTIVNEPAAETTYRVKNNGPGSVKVNLSGRIVTTLHADEWIDVGVGTEDTLKITAATSGSEASGTYHTLPSTPSPPTGTDAPLHGTPPRVAFISRG